MALHCSENKESEREKERWREKRRDGERGRSRYRQTERGRARVRERKREACFDVAGVRHIGQT